MNPDDPARESPNRDENQTPLISVIIPTYQAGETLGRALSSVTGQDFKDYEVLLMDGGSTDSTSEIALACRKQFPQVRFYSESDGGVFEAMNKGIKLARGRWLYFLGADDCLHSPETLRQVAAFFQDDLDVVYGNVVSPRWNGVYGGEFDGARILDQNICHQAIFFRRSVFDSLGSFDPKYRFAADWEFNFRWILSTKIRKRHVDQVIANYADGGLSSQNRDFQFEEERMLRYVAHGKDALSFRTKILIIAKETKRAVRSLNLPLFLRSQGAWIRMIAGK
jgi:glycosyltransferase involved in cell wall biosynthesis